MTRNKFTILFIKLCWIVYVVKGIHRKDILPYGPLSGDLTLQEGDDETSKVIVLTRPMHFYEASFPNLYVATNGIISTLDLPMEKQYVDDGFPTDFPVIAPFLADLDTSNGRGTIYYRQTESPNILNRVAMEVHRGFPDARFTPTHAVVVTWENVGAYEEGSRSIGPSNRVNTFQAVVAYDGTDTYALFLYPEDGLRFFGTRPKESYNVEIELPARVGFSRGEVSFLFFSRQEGPYYSITSNEQSVKNLYQVGNTGVPGVWLFHIGSSYSFENVIPASVGGVLATGPPFDAELEHATTPEYSEYSESDYPEFQSPTLPEFVEAGPDPSLLQSPGQPQVQLYGEDVPFTSSPEIPETPNSESGPREYPAVPEPRNRPPEDSGLPQRPVPEHTILEVYPNRQGESPRYTPNSQVDSELEGVDIDTGVIQYNAGSKDTCERFGQQCSQSAYCSDYATGFCCHCRSSFYGNGRHCLPNGAPHRVNGKVNGVVLVGSTPVELNNIDMHAYVVVGDGRAYTAISEVPEPAGWALMPVAPIGGLFGWLFALELPNSQNGFTITGAEFTRHADITFYPGNQRLYIVQTGKGLDTENYLSVDTQLRGSVPFIPPGSTVQMEPFKVTFQYYPSVATSTSVREFTVVSAESGAETFSFQLRQNITYQDCRHGPRSGPETQELSVERVFAMYVKEERILRYAITNKIGPVGAGNPDPGEVNPCYAGTHDCDTTAQCIPGEGQLYQCQCATGYRGDGRNCYDIDECAERLSSCGAHAQCENLQGSHRCLCQPGYEFGFDGRTCIDVDECRSQPCHAQAICSNALGSFQCQCQSGFHGNGFQCYPQNGGPDRPKTQCEHHRDSVQGSQDGFSLVGAFIPECDEEGQYRPLQCHGSTGHCWCVSDQGQERAGTRAPPGSPRPNCDEQVQPERPKTQCQHHRDSLQGGVGAFVPECDEEGRYRQLQCHGSTGHCWCVSDQGQERAGTRTPAGSPRPNCDEQVQPERPKTQCEHHRDSLQGSQGGVGAFVPQCDEEGQYRQLQCHGSTGQCWCVSDQGQERAGTRTPAGSPRPNCDEQVQPERPKTQCQHHRDGLQGGVGAFVPECDEEGRYRQLQCHGSTGHCWCVSDQGQERAGTRAPPGSPRPNCDEQVQPERPKTQCQHHRDSLQGSQGGVGAFVPQCDEEGQYRPLQCHGSSGHCWCVDNQGQERADTRTLPGTPPTNCDEPVRPERPKTHCEHYRDSQGSQDGFPQVGAFIPECDEEGQYRPLQCHGSIGQCWCVDNQGQERAGTKTPRGTPPPNCDQPDRPKTQCEHHRDSAQDGFSLVGALIPECDEEGRYRPLQCHGSTGHCWCVSDQGQERAGTRTPPGSPRPNCDEQVRPERPKTQCEHHRDGLQGSQVGVGAFVPQCDEEGQYHPLQCHGSSGHCWCVSDQGQERAGTRTPPGSPQPNCNEQVQPERPKTQCQHHRDSLQGSQGGVGAFVPQCDEEGQYRPLQCHGSTGQCWCVSDQGQERAGTRTPAGTPPINCDGPVVVPPTQRPETVCERWRASLIEHYGGQPDSRQYLPQCDWAGEFNPVQCYGDSSYCWCVDKDGREVPGTRSNDAVKPGCIPTVAPPTMRPLPRPDVTPPPVGVSLLYAQGQQIGALPLTGTRMDKDKSSVLLQLHGSIVVGVAHDCQEGKVYWTDIAGRTINRASLVAGSEPEVLINTDLTSPEGLALDVVRRKMFWVDSTMDKIETSNLDGTGRRVLFDKDLVNPRAIIVDSSSGTLYWTDWNREAPKLESASVDGQNRKVLVQEGIGLPNAITFNPISRQVCWADAGTKRLECISPDGTGRRVIHSGLSYPFAMVFHANHFYFTDWRRDAIISMSKGTSQFTDDYLPEQRSHLYGIAVASPSCL